MRANFQEKRTTLTFSTKICPIMGFGVGISKIKVRIQNPHTWDTICTIFQTKQTTLNFRAQILGLEFQKSKVGFGINTSNIPCVPIFSQNGQLLIFWPKFGEIAQLRAIFWFKYCWGCCRELSGGWNELGGGGWSWVEVGAWFSNTHHQKWERFYQ